MDCIKKHVWRVVAIFFILTTIGLSVGWGITSEPVSFKIFQKTKLIGHSAYSILQDFTSQKLKFARRFLGRARQRTVQNILFLIKFQCDPTSTVAPASMNPKIIVPEIQDPSGST